MAILKPITVNENVKVSKTKMDGPGLSKFFTGPSNALKREADITTGKIRDFYANEPKVEILDTRPTYIQRREMRREERAKRIQEEHDNDMMLFVRLVQKNK